jgi:GDP-L-fucose synthase
MDLTKEKIVVTGGAGFLGRYVVALLQQGGCVVDGKNIAIIRSKDYDLTTEADVCRLYDEIHPTIVIHLAAVVGGIGINKDNPGTFFYKNLMMGTLMMEYARQSGVKKFVATGTICAYPNNTPVPFKEKDLWNGYPEITNAPYGLAKKMMLVQAQAYRQEFGFNAIYLLPVNLYGPHDNFDLYSSHVIPALIRKCIEARDEGWNVVECWGTGAASREFLYVEDCANAIVAAMIKYDGGEPVNLGSGNEIRIVDLAKLIAKHTGFSGQFKWDTSKPDGQPRRCLNIVRAKNFFDFEAKVSLEKGIKQTVEWYENARNGSNISR